MWTWFERVVVEVTEFDEDDEDSVTADEDRFVRKVLFKVSGALLLGQLESLLPVEIADLVSLFLQIKSLKLNWRNTLCGFELLMASMAKYSGLWTVWQ